VSQIKTTMSDNQRLRLKSCQTQEVPHAHIHLIPIDSVADMNFSKPKLKLAPEEMQKIAASIKAHL
jgi:diadenosine tetraphosphate (Ap4A) HIT family hydrolase